MKAPASAVTKAGRKQRVDMNPESTTSLTETAAEGKDTACGMSAEIACAAKWWADCLRGTTAHNIGDDDGMASMMMTLIGARQPYVGNESVERFERAAIDWMTECAAKQSEPWITLSTDYGPDWELSEICQIAGINPGMQFPAKTMMSVRPGSVKVSRGYGAQRREIFTQESAQ